MGNFCSNCDQYVHVGQERRTCTSVLQIAVDPTAIYKTQVWGCILTGGIGDFAKIDGITIADKPQTCCKCS